MVDLSHYRILGSIYPRSVPNSAKLVEILHNFSRFLIDLFWSMLPRRQSAPALALPCCVVSTSSSKEATSTAATQENLQDSTAVATSATDGAGEQLVERLPLACDKPQEASISDFLVSLLECPVCFGYMMPPIMQCSRGHLICSSCRQKLTVCPVCRTTMSNIRNLAMEKVASKLIFPCKHTHFGCCVRLSYADKKGHEDDCEFRPYFCPYPDEKCIWQGALKDVYKHLITSHENVITMEGSDIIFLATNVNLEGALDWTMIQSCHGRHFLLSLEKIHLGEGCQQYFAACRMIGSMRDASEFVYGISVEANNRTLKWQSKPRSIRESFVSFTNADFLVLNKSTVELFSEDGNLALNVIINRAEDINES
ncbi:probable E3 ubiquitin-protein ligase sinah [Drosophila tropicalis]|uniref:probable E3 ubiquitin-protein ligase sinah n=1 Tax=Drosophila tropicalis TaxID=46794 RepID=UPI0035ABF167